MTTTPFEDRRLRFEAKRLALETFVKIHVEQANGCRSLLLMHSRLMFTLSLAALAGVMTVFAASMRDGSLSPGLSLDPILMVPGLISLALLVASALLAARNLQQQARTATEFLRNPFPKAEKELEVIFCSDTADEAEILREILATIDSQLGESVPGQRGNLASIGCLVLGLLAAAVIFAFPF